MNHNRISPTGDTGLLSRRRFLPALAVPVAACLPTIPPLPPGLLWEGRRLAAAYLDAARAWVECSEAYDRTTPDAAPIGAHRNWEARLDGLCGRHLAAQKAMLSFVVRASGRTPLPRLTNAADLDTWPAAAVLIDGTLWIASQDGNDDGGELLLSRVILADVVRPGSEGGVL